MASTRKVAGTIKTLVNAKGPSLERTRVFERGYDVTVVNVLQWDYDMVWEA